jgi:hypothetical protein
MLEPPTRPIADNERNTMREGALTYRRVGRTAKAEGCLPPERERRARDTAHEAYRQLVPDAPADRLSVSSIINPMIAEAIRADTDWFWRGPDA